MRVLDEEGTSPKQQWLIVEPLSREHGEKAAELERPGSQLRAVLSGYDASRHYVTFFVWDDSFEAYVEARRVVESMGFAAG